VSPDDIDTFVLKLTDFLNPMLPPEKHMGNFFDTDDNYQPLSDFCLDYFEKFYTRDRNYN
jgi:hypothetical protein